MPSLDPHGRTYHMQSLVMKARSVTVGTGNNIAVMGGGSSHFLFSTFHSAAFDLKFHYSSRPSFMNFHPQQDLTYHCQSLVMKARPAMGIGVDKAVMGRGGGQLEPCLPLNISRPLLGMSYSCSFSNDPFANSQTNHWQSSIMKARRILEQVQC